MRLWQTLKRVTVVKFTVNSEGWNFVFAAAEVLVFSTHED